MKLAVIAVCAITLVSPLKAICSDKTAISSPDVNASSIQVKNLPPSSSLLTFKDFSLNAGNGNIITAESATSFISKGVENIFNGKNVFLTDETGMFSPVYFGDAQILSDKKSNVKVISSQVILPDNSILSRGTKLGMQLFGSKMSPMVGGPNGSYSCSSNNTIIHNGSDTGATQMCGNGWTMSCSGGLVNVTMGTSVGCN